MKQRRLKQLILVAIVCLTLILGKGVHAWFGWRECPDPATGVGITLWPVRQIVKVGDEPLLVATLVNHGGSEVVLVEPGDGSEIGWRTPEIEWHGGEAPKREGRCGNMNGFKRDEIFVLKPGESRQLCGWVGVPQLTGPGKYRVALRYVNQPDHEWGGMATSRHDEDALREVRRSNAVTAISNTVEIVVEE
jgi:hypothetical protein